MNKRYLQNRNKGFWLRIVIITVFLYSFIYGPLNGSLVEKTAVADDNGAGTADSSPEVVSESLRDIYQQKENLTPTQKKIDMDILQSVGIIEEVGPVAAFSAQVTPENTEPSPSLPALVKTDSAGNIEVELTVSGINAEQLKELENLGMNVTITLPEYGIVEGWLPHDQVEVVAGLGFVTHVGTPGYPITNSGAVNSEGDAVLKADLARATFGVDGSGIKIGVMSDGVTHLADSVASGDLPSSPAVSVLKAGSGDEGTAMLEIIHDLAPGASLAFYSPTTSADMVVGIQALEASGCRIIVDDLSFSTERKFEDGPIAQEARAFVNRGGVYVTSCGNEAQTHYYHGYVRTSGIFGYPYAHNYGGGDIHNTFAVANGQTITVILQWNDQWGKAGDDFDIILYRPSDGTLLKYSNNTQIGTGNPYEEFDYTNTIGTTDTVSIAVLEDRLTSDPSSLILDYHVWNGYGLEYNTPENSVIGHAAVTEVISTAAVAAATPGTIEPFSSQGPGTIYFPASETRQVPNITGTDGVSTYTGQAGHFSKTFYGTSAAAPHLAAIAALVWQANPTLTPTGIQNILNSTADDLGASGVDYIYGWGRVDAYEAVNAAAIAVTINPAAAQADPTNTSPINFTVVFSASVTDFVSGDVTLSGTAGANTATVTGSGTTYNVAVSGMTSDGTVIATIAAGKAHDAAGKPNTASTSTDNTVTYDTTAPTVTINQAAAQADPTNTSPINFTVVFSEPVTDFVSGDVTLSGTAGGNTATVTGSGTTYNVAVSGMISDGTVIATIAAGKAHDAAGNANTASTSTDNTVTYDTTGPTVTINQAAAQADPTNTSPINFTAVFSEPVTDFVTGDVTLSGTAGGTKTATVTGSGTTYNVAVSGMTSNGTVIASIAAGKAHDAAGNSNTASTSTDNTVTYDTTAPTVTINQAAGQADPTNTSPINFTVLFNEPVTDFATGDVTLSGTAGATTATITGSGTTYSVAVSGMTSDGTVIASIAAGKAHDAAGNANTASTSTDNQVTYDATAPTVTINQAAGQADPTNTSPINFAVVFSESVTDFATGDVTLSGTAGATTATVTGSGTTYNVAVIGMTSDGTVIATIAAGIAHDAAGNPNTASTSTDNTVTYDTTAPIITSAQTKTTTSIAVMFSEDVNGATVNKADFAAAGNTVITASRTASGVVTLTLGTAIATDATPNVTYTKGTLADPAGNLVTTTMVTASDGIAPTLTSVDIASNNAKPTLAKGGDTVTLTILASESLQTPTVIIASHDAMVLGSGTGWTARYNMTSEDTEWLVTFSIAFSDLAGNGGTPVTYTTDGSFVTTLEDVALIRGFTYEVNHNALSGVTITLKKDGLEIATTISNSEGNYTIIAPQIGTYSVIASKTGFRDDTQSINITTLEQEYPLNFKGKNGIIPKAPDIWYLLDCAALWKYPPADPELGLDIWRLLDVAAAWKYPLS